MSLHVCIEYITEKIIKHYVELSSFWMGVLFSVHTSINCRSFGYWYRYLARGEFWWLIFWLILSVSIASTSFPSHFRKINSYFYWNVNRIGANMVYTIFDVLILLKDWKHSANNMAGLLISFVANFHTSGHRSERDWTSFELHFVFINSYKDPKTWTGSADPLCCFATEFSKPLWRWKIKWRSRFKYKFVSPKVKTEKTKRGVKYRVVWGFYW